MRINVNNGGFIEIERTYHGVSAASCDEKGYVERRDRFTDGEIVMALNLLRYIRDNDLKCAWVQNAGKLEEFKIFQ